MSSGAVPISCNKDCGGGCPLLAHVESGRLVRITDNPSRPALMRGCARGYAMSRTVYAPDRVTSPLLRDGPRGSGRFREARWEEAMALIAERLQEIRAKHGPGAVILLGGSGSCRGALHNTELLSRRFFALFGGCTSTSGGYSSAAERFVAPYLFGTPFTGIDPAALRFSRLILMWGANVADTRFGSSLEAWIRRRRREGVPVVAVDPRRTRTASRLAGTWIPVRPGTDAALMAAVLHVLLEEGCVDRGFLERYTTGFEAVEAYVRGQTLDHRPKTPQWASEICGTPQADIVRLARLYGGSRPAALIPGLSIQRTVGGEEAMRMAAVLQAATGNAGVPGGTCGGNIWGRLPSPRCSSLPVPPAAGAPAVPVYRWADAVLEGRAGGFPSDIRAAYTVGGNYLCQGADVSKNIRAFDSLELSVCHDYFLTPTARWSDIVLPATTFLEREDIVFPEGNFLFYSRQAIGPVGRARNDYDILCDLAGRLGFGGAFSEGRSAAQWLDSFLADSEVPDPEEFRSTGIYMGRDQERTALSDFISDPRRHPLETPSGRIELASESYARTGFPAVPAWRGVLPDRAYPLALISPHARYRINSQYANDPQLVAREPQALWMNPRDARKRGVREGTRVIVSSPQGSVRVPVLITEDIMRGVVSLSAGMWPEMDVNFLTSTEPTHPSNGSRTHSVAVDVRPDDT